MIRVARVLALLMLVSSSLGFAGAFYLVSDWNWAPVKMPMPGPGLSVDEVFDITSAGEFRFEASVPTASEGMAIEDLRAESCDLQVALGPRGAGSHIYRLKQFRAGGRGGGLDTYSAETVVSLQRGTYALRVWNHGTTQPFGERGAVISFTRFVYPTEYYLQGVFLRGIGWFGLVGGVLLGAVGEKFSSRVPHQKRSEPANH